jgi:hypothetical protein
VLAVESGNVNGDRCFSVCRGKLTVGGEEGKERGSEVVSGSGCEISTLAADGG